jgi:hypothetical protein
LYHLFSRSDWRVYTLSLRWVRSAAITMLCCDPHARFSHLAKAWSVSQQTSSSLHCTSLSSTTSYRRRDTRARLSDIEIHVQGSSQLGTWFLHRDGDRAKQGIRSLLSPVIFKQKDQGYACSKRRDDAPKQRRAKQEASVGRRCEPRSYRVEPVTECASEGLTARSPGLTQQSPAWSPGPPTPRVHAMAFSSRIDAAAVFIPVTNQMYWLDGSGRDHARVSTSPPWVSFLER